MSATTISSKPAAFDPTRIAGLAELAGRFRSRALSVEQVARAYLDRIESLVEAPITFVSVGTRRDQIIGL